MTMCDRHCLKPQSMRNIVFLERCDKHCHMEYWWKYTNFTHYKKVCLDLNFMYGETHRLNMFKVDVVFLH